MSTLVLTVGIVSVVAHVVFSMLIVNEVSKRGVKINVPMLRIFIIKYAEQYRQFTKQETGSVGSLFYLWIFSINIALACVLAAILFHLF